MGSAEEEAWLSERRSEVASYLKSEGVAYREIGEYPAWHLWPYVSIWAIESIRSPGWVGWWVVCGDHPTDYLSAKDVKDPRAAMRAIGERWSEVGAFMLRGKTHPSISLGTPEQCQNSETCFGHGLRSFSSGQQMTMFGGGQCPDYAFR